MGIAQHSIVFVPHGTPDIKIRATQSYGVTVQPHGESFREANEEAQRISHEQGKAYIPAFDDLDIIRGQATVGLEILREHPDTDIIIVPVGGGGLISGIACAANHIKSTTRIIGVQAEGAASFVHSFRLGNRAKLDQAQTIAEGIKVDEPGNENWSIIQHFVKQQDMVSVDDSLIVRALQIFTEITNMIAETAGVVGIAALEEGENKITGLYPHTAIPGSPLSH
jgi:threonine dehydratase